MAAKNLMLSNLIYSWSTLRVMKDHPADKISHGVAYIARPPYLIACRLL